MIRSEDPIWNPGRSSVHADGQSVAPQAPSRVAASAESAGTSLRLQVLDIIGGLLDSTGPELEDLRIRLRAHVQEHPGEPETALLQYLWDRERRLSAPPGRPPSSGPRAPNPAS